MSGWRAVCGPGGVDRAKRCSCARGICVDFSRDLLAVAVESINSVVCIRSIGKLRRRDGGGQRSEISDVIPGSRIGAVADRAGKIDNRAIGAVDSVVGSGGLGILDSSTVTCFIRPV